MVHESINTLKFRQLLELNETLNNFSIGGSGVIQTPTQFISSGSGSNWDYCICEAFKINNELQIPVKCYSLEIGDEFINFTVFKNQLYWYWFESFDKNFKGIHEFHSWVRMINFITHKYGKERANFKLSLREINPLDNRVFGMSDESYKEYLKSHQIIEITDTRIEEPMNYINENGAMKKFSDTTENGVEYLGDEGVGTRLLADDDEVEKPGRMSFRFKLGNLKTKGINFSLKNWDIAIRKFAINQSKMTDENMRKSLQQQIQRYKILARTALTEAERRANAQRAIDLQNEGTLRGYSATQATDNKPSKPSNMDHQDSSNGKDEKDNPPPRVIDDDEYNKSLNQKFQTRTDGDLGEAGSQSNNNIIDPNADQSTQSIQSQMKQPSKSGGVLNFLGGLAKTTLSGFGARYLTHLATGG